MRLVPAAIAIFCFPVFLIASSEIIKLPGYYDPKPLSLAPIGEGNNLEIDVSVTLPPGQKLNKSASSSVGVFEKHDGKWHKTAHLDLNSVLSFGQKVETREKVSLRTRTGKVVLASAIYHCASDGGLCMIDYYQGALDRKKNIKSKTVAIKMKATPPKF